MKEILRRVLLACLLVGGTLALIGNHVANHYLRQPYTAPAEPTFQVHRAYLPEQAIPQADDLQRTYGHNKCIPEAFKWQILIALAHYPELRDATIEFIVKPALIPAASRPAPVSLVRTKERWVYRVILSSESSLEGTEKALLKNLSFNAQVGVIGHELAHTAFYQNKSRWEMMGIALAYPFPKFRARFEKDTDRRTVDHGLGWQLYAWASEVRQGPYPDLLDTYYLRPDSILTHMRSSHLYQFK
ncbi:hypothetical protein SAMN05421823_105279 [Catalinimonas alkaloidigena]|uniref:Uncharacterized protein n=1 Tax=Catalinimonas alkaloidigena TaxID=1075417 RepID=A0A1G9JE29_9BACT|nr:hypothetical protein [Catalinimonas alkaloidigena]SDL35374.1 hypothetical protein SAMN05421823_105279 [Catalinimonas alkaloidigena]